MHYFHEALLVYFYLLQQKKLVHIYILLFLLTVLVVYALWLSRGSKRQVFIIFLISLGILKLFLSNTFLTEPFFFMLIGVCITEIINHARTHYIL